MDVKLSYGIRDGHIVHISEVKPANKGEKCNCTCPVCNGILIARLGEKRQWHFAHKASCECDIVEAQQTGLHLLAKEIIRKNDNILVPKLSITFHDVTTSTIDIATTAEINIDLPDIKSSIVQYDSVEIEKPIGDIIADAVISVNGKPIIIEIAVTHFVDEIKAKKIEALGLTALEIDLSNLLESPQTPESIEEAVLTDEDNRQWIFNPKRECLLQKKRVEFQNKYTATLRKRELEEKRKQENRRKNLLKLQKLMEPENYADELRRLRNDKEAALWLRRFDFSKGLTEYPFYMDIPITGEFVISCDRRIWQGKLFENYVYRGFGKDLCYFKTSKIISWISTGKAIFQFDKQKTYRTIILLNGQEKEIYFPFDVIQRYFEYLDLLGFVEHLSYEWFSRRPVSLNPPNQCAASILKDVLKSVNPFCPHIDHLVKDKLLLKLDENDVKKVLDWDKVKNSDKLCI